MQANLGTEMAIKKLEVKKKKKVGSSVRENWEDPALPSRRVPGALLTLGQRLRQCEPVASEQPWETVSWFYRSRSCLLPVLLSVKIVEVGGGLEPLSRNPHPTPQLASPRGLRIWGCL